MARNDTKQQVEKLDEMNGTSKVQSVADASSVEDSKAEAFLEHLLNDGALEGESGAEMELPSYYDERLFAQGQRYLSKYRFAISSAMLSGLVAVLAVPSILRVLMCTRQSSTCATAYRRYVRTIFQTNSWYEYSPASKNSKFWTSLRAVRKAHQRSSSACVKRSAGQITQKDLALTQFGFIGFITLGAPRIQLYDEDFLESTSHMWRVLGYLLGIKDEYNLCGATWEVTKQRLAIVMERVYKPALSQTSDDFAKMTEALLNGLWPVNTSLTVGSVLYFTKRMCYVDGYEYYDFDYPSGSSLKGTPPKCLEYYKLGWWDRFVVSYGLFMVTYLHKYDIVRWYLNLRVWMDEQLMRYLPYVAIWKYGIKVAYVSVFTRTGKGKEFEFNLKED